MIKFFRKIRERLLSENKFSKYLIYAIGEIVLVVIGILIALSINNWNERRKNTLLEDQLIKNIVEDLRLDSIHINQSLNELSSQLSVVDNLIAQVLDDKENLNFDSTELVRFSSDFRPITQQNHAESVSNLKNESKREFLQNYFLKEDRVSDSFLEYEDIIHNQLRAYMRETGMHNLESLSQRETGEKEIDLIKPKKLIEQLDVEKFQQLLFERRLKTDGFLSFLTELNLENKVLIKSLEQTDK